MYPLIATVGDNCMDVYDNIGKACPGGNPVNVAVYLARMGAQASYTGIVGSDAYGEMMVRAIAEKGVDVRHVKQVEGTTAITHIELVDGERIMGDYEEGVLENFTLDPEAVAYLAEQKLVVSALWGNSHPYFAQIQQGGAKIAYDAAIRPFSEPAQAAMPYVDYLFYSSDDGDTPALREEMQTLYAQGPSLVVATLGEAGSVAYDGTTFYTHGITACPVVDTMGAGDSYIAGFLLGLSLGESIPACMQRGADCAAETIGYFGAW